MDAFYMSVAEFWIRGGLRTDVADTFLWLLCLEIVPRVWDVSYGREPNSNQLPY